MATDASPAPADLAFTDADALARVAERFAVRLTPHLEAAIAEAPTDAARAALARQFVPSAAELEITPDERADPIGDDVHSPVPGLVHRYPDRVLLMPVEVCAAYCRFCFRRAVVGQGDGLLPDADLDRAVAYIAERPDIWEVILTGGDPLVLSPRRLKALVARLDAIAHVGVIRLHSRLPVHDPARVTPALVDALAAAADSAVWLAVHANHAAEFTAETRNALRRLSGAGIPLVGQTVLLRGVNDTAEALTDLFRAMVRNRIKPYYLHHPDLAEGTGHVRLPLAEGRRLVKALRGTVSGLCQPTYVLDIPGGHGKVPVGPDALRDDPGHTDATIVEDPWGRPHRYPPVPEGGA
ncbi:lysine-2,3-aminomutase-like protein [Caenispirillum salinarum]|uniref:lysine-2,3-aminomutase-like protein n=1 Tax=Caenispirillum salinarum TaxID=859058 RepID=UPI00384E7898